MSKVMLIAGMCKQVPYDSDYDYIGIDHGALCCLRQQIPMVCAIGDFDSITKAEKEQLQLLVEIAELPEHKNETDTEVAILYAFQKGYEEIILYGALGGRMDHELANLYLLIHREYPIILMNEQNRIRVIQPGTYHIKKEYTYISFLALKDSCITETGVAYPLYKRQITIQDIYAISNEITASEAVIILHSGKMLMIEASDYK